MHATKSNGMSAKALQVRVDAVVALRNLMDAFDEDHLADIKPHIGKLLEQLFCLMAEV